MLNSFKASIFSKGFVMLFIFICFNELNLFMQRRLFVYLLMVVSCFLFYKASILKKEFDFFNKKIKANESLCIALFVVSGSIKKLLSINCDNIYFLSKIFVVLSR